MAIKEHKATPTPSKHPSDLRGDTPHMAHPSGVCKQSPNTCHACTPPTPFATALLQVLSRPTRRSGQTKQRHCESAAETKPTACSLGCPHHSLCGWHPPFPGTRPQETNTVRTGQAMFTAPERTTARVALVLGIRAWLPASSSSTSTF